MNHKLVGMAAAAAAHTAARAAVGREFCRQPRVVRTDVDSQGWPPACCATAACVLTEAADKYGYTALTKASFNGRLPVVQMLIDAGVNMELMTALGGCGPEIARSCASGMGWGANVKKYQKASKPRPMTLKGLHLLSEAQGGAF
eukprot:1637031-Prymnesium_polylepis.1